MEELSYRSRLTNVTSFLYCQWATGIMCEYKLALHDHFSNSYGLNHSPVWEVPELCILEDNTMAQLMQNTQIVLPSCSQDGRVLTNSQLS